MLTWAMDSFTIKDLENLSGIKAHTIRVWEQRFGLLKPKRTSTNIRYYSNEELKRILNIALLNKYGFKISLIDRMSEDGLKEKILSLTHGDALHDKVSNDMIHAMVDLDIESFEDILDEQIRARGIEKTILRIIFPFLERIGVLWLTNSISPAQEHLISNAIRQKLIVGIEKANAHFQVPCTVMLYLPAGEHHELGLLFVSFLFKCKGVQLIYLGADVPLPDLEYVIKIKKPDYLYTHLTSTVRWAQMEKYIHRIALQYPQLPQVISGRIVNKSTATKHATVEYKQDFNEVMAFINAV